MEHSHELDTVIKRQPGKRWMKCITCSGSGTVYAGIGTFRPCKVCRGKGWVRDDKAEQSPAGFLTVSRGTPQLEGDVV